MTRLTCRTCRHGRWCLERDRQYPCRNYSGKERAHNEKKRVSATRGRGENPHQ